MSGYFQGLNYSLANEDTWVEYDLLPSNVGSVFSVCGSGSRVLPLLAKNPSELHVVDLSDNQLRLFRLRHAAAKHLSRSDFLFLLGYKNIGSGTRLDLMSKLSLNDQDEKFWKAMESSWAQQGFIYLGKWESHFMKMGKLFRMLPFIDVAPLFEAKTTEEQRQIVDKHWKPIYFKLFTKVVLNEWVSNKLLYKGSFAGSSKKKTTKYSTADMVFSEFNDLFQNTHVRSNYFLNMIFLGHVSYPEAYPCECHEDVVEGIKKSASRIFFHQENLLNLLRTKPHDFYSLSDTFSYMQDSDVDSFLSTLPPEIKSGSQMVIRTFMRKPNFEISAPWKTNVEHNSKLAKKDCTRVYEFTRLEKA